MDKQILESAHKHLVLGACCYECSQLLCVLMEMFLMVPLILLIVY